MVVLAGLFAWSIEDEYGSGLNYMVEQGPETWTVYEVSEGESAGRRVVFEGPPEEAQAYMERERAARESFVVPGLIIAAGALLLVIGLLPIRRRRQQQESPGQR